MELVADGATCQLVRVANSNDGKRSEWCEFLRKNDQLQIVPPTSRALLASSVHDVLVGVRRVGDGVPPGAEPIVDAANIAGLRCAGRAAALEPLARATAEEAAHGGCAHIGQMTILANTSGDSGHRREHAV